MTCPHIESQVIDSRKIIGGTRRRRRCDSCQATFATVEVQTGDSTPSEVRQFVSAFLLLRRTTRLALYKLMEMGGLS